MTDKDQPQHIESLSCIIGCTAFAAVASVPLFLFGYLFGSNTVARIGIILAVWPIATLLVIWLFTLLARFVRLLTGDLFSDPENPR
jgi:hypothetical protein